MDARSGGGTTRAARGEAGVAGPPELDLRGEVCPYTFLKAKLALEPMRGGDLLRVVVDNPQSASDVPRSLAGGGHEVLAVEPRGDGAWAILVRRGVAPPSGGLGG